MNKKILISIMLVLAVLLPIMSINVLAATGNEYGLNTEILTDKQEYKENDTVQLTIKVTNTNAFEVKNITIESILPEDLKLTPGAKGIKKISSLAEGESVELKVNTFMSSESSNESIDDNSNPKTGDIFNIHLYLIIAIFSLTGILVIVKYRKKTVKYLSLLLCAIILLPLTANNNRVSAESNVISFTISEQIKISGKIKEVTAKITYDNEDKKQLTAPNNVKSNDTDQTISWDPVENANGYYIFTTDGYYFTESNMLSYANFNVYDKGYASVVAVSKDEKYVASDFSNSVAFNFIEPGLQSLRTTINNFETETKTTYLGQGYNVIKSAYINGEDVMNTYPIFKDGIRDTTINVDSANNSVKITKVEGDSLDSFMRQFNEKVTAKTDIDTPWVMFTGSFSAQRSGTNQGEVSRHYIKNSVESRKTIVTWGLNPSQYSANLDANFKSDLENINVTPQTLFNKYGTHFIRSAVLGGKIDFNYELYSTTQKDLSEYANSITANISSTYVKFDANAERKVKTEAASKNVIITTNSTTLGGSSVAMSSLDEMSKNYQSWLTSLKDNCALIDIKDNQSLVPLWDLLPDGERKTALKNYFNQYGSQNYHQLMEKYPSSSDIPTLNIQFQTPKIADDYNGYNTNVPNNFAHSINCEYSRQQIGELLLSNCKLNSDKTYSAVSGIGLMYKLTVNPNRVINKTDNDWHKTLDSLLTHDIAKAPLTNFPSFDGEVGKGIYYVQVLFNDNTTKSWVKTDFINYKLQNDTIDLLENQDLSGHSKIKSITVKVAYELYVNYARCDKNGVFHYTEVYPNIVTEQTINFSK